MTSKTRKPSAKRGEEVRATIARHARIQRPSLLDFMLADFWALPKLPQSVVDSPIVRADDFGHAGWVVPADSLGRKGADTIDDISSARSTAESIRIWVAKFFSDIIDPATIAVVVEPKLPPESGNVIKIYRKA